MKNKKDNW